VTAAFIGLAGVVIGAMMQGAVTACLARRERTRKTVAAARLLAESMQRTTHVLRSTQLAGFFIDEWDGPHSMGAWIETRGILAERLSYPDWATVQSAVGCLDGVVTACAHGPKHRPLDDVDRAFLEGARNQLGRACEVLNRLSVGRSDRAAYNRMLAEQRQAETWLEERWTEPIGFLDSDGVFTPVEFNGDAADSDADLLRAAEDLGIDLNLSTEVSRANGREDSRPLRTAESKAQQQPTPDP
jgi:hypothetical protein